MGQVMKLPMDLLLLAVDKHGLAAYRWLLERGWDRNVVLAKFDKAYRKGYMEYGSTSTLGWLTDKGQRFIQ